MTRGYHNSQTTLCGNPLHAVVLRVVTGTRLILKGQGHVVEEERQFFAR
jgi:hypothetical protein